MPFQLNKSVLLALLLCALFPVVYGQTKDSGSLGFTGNLSTTTCVLNIADSTGNAPVSSTRALVLGSYVSKSAIVGGSAIGLGKYVVMTLTSPDSTPCPVTSWNISMNLTQEQIFAFNVTSNAIKNSTAIADGGTDAAVAVWGGTFSSLNRLLLQTGGQALSSQSVSPSTSILFWAIMVAGTNSVNIPTPGKYYATVPLSVTYN